MWWRGSISSADLRSRHQCQADTPKSFSYSGSVITPDARSTADIHWRIALAFSACGSLRSIRLDDQLSLAIRQRLYSACVLMVLLCGAECWASLGTDLRRMDAFHHQYLCDMLIISWERRKSDRITSPRLRLMWGDTASISYHVRHHQLEWLTHVARMEDARLPKHLLFSSMPFPRLACGPHLLWKDVISHHCAGCGCRDWFELQGNCWQREVVSCILDAELRIELVMCPLCHQLFSWPSDMKRHKCTAVHLLPIHYSLALLGVLSVIAGLLCAVDWLCPVVRFRIRSILLHQSSAPHWRSVHPSPLLVCK